MHKTIGTNWGGFCARFCSIWTLCRMWMTSGTNRSHTNSEVSCQKIQKQVLCRMWMTSGTNRSHTNSEVSCQKIQKLVLCRMWMTSGTNCCHDMLWYTTHNSWSELSQNPRFKSNKLAQRPSHWTYKFSAGCHWHPAETAWCCLVRNHF